MLYKYNNVKPGSCWRRIAVLTVLACCLSLSAVQAQIGAYRNEFSIGAGGGYVLSNVDFMPEVPQGQHGGFLAGLAFRYTSEKYFNSICAIVAEANIAQIGWKEEILTPANEPVINEVTGLPEAYQRDITYLQVPVFARLGWGRERKGFQAFFQIGPQMGFYLSDKARANFELEQRNRLMRTSQVIEQDTMAIEKKFDYGIVGGLGLEYSHPKVGHFLLEARYYYGLGNIYGSSKRDFFGRSSFGNIVFKLTYLFDLKKTNNPKIK